MDRWFDDYTNVLQLAAWLVESYELNTPREVLYYFGKPWKYTEEWERMVKEIKCATHCSLHGRAKAEAQIAPQARPLLKSKKK